MHRGFSTFIVYVYVWLGCPKDGLEESGEECFESVTMECGVDDCVSSEGESSDSWESENEVSNRNDSLYANT